VYVCVKAYMYAVTHIHSYKDEKRETQTHVNKSVNSYSCNKKYICSYIEFRDNNKEILNFVFDVTVKLKFIQAISVLCSEYFTAF